MDRETLAGRLLMASAEHSFDPTVDVDWTAAFAPDTFFCPPRFITLYGTPMWYEMTREQRVELSRHEVASVTAAALWFEMVLMQMLLRYAYDRDPTSLHVQYALTQIRDESRHSVVFARLVERLGCPRYGVSRYKHELGRLMKSVAGGPHMFAAILVGKEIADALQRVTMTDESVQPLVRTVARMHVVEKAPHVRYARAELARMMADRGWLRRPVDRLLAARTAYTVASRLVHPGVYAAVGLDPRRAVRQARANPHLRSTRVWAARRVVGYLNDVGMVGGPGLLLWRRAGLVGTGW